MNMKLKGMLAISKHLGFSESTVMSLKRDKDFPMENVDGVWEADTEDIKAWRGDTPPKSTEKPQKKEKSKSKKSTKKQK